MNGVTPFSFTAPPFNETQPSPAVSLHIHPESLPESPAVSLRVHPEPDTDSPGRGSTPPEARVTPTVELSPINNEVRINVEPLNRPPPPSRCSKRLIGNIALNILIPLGIVILLLCVAYSLADRKVGWYAVAAIGLSGVVNFMVHKKNCIHQDLVGELREFKASTEAVLQHGKDEKKRIETLESLVAERDRQLKLEKDANAKLIADAEKINKDLEEAIARISAMDKVHKAHAEASSKKLDETLALFSRQTSALKEGSGKIEVQMGLLSTFKVQLDEQVKELEKENIVLGQHETAIRKFNGDFSKLLQMVQEFISLIETFYTAETKTRAEVAAIARSLEETERKQNADLTLLQSERKLLEEERKSFESEMKALKEKKTELEVLSSKRDQQIKRLENLLATVGDKLSVHR